MPLNHPKYRKMQIGIWNDYPDQYGKRDMIVHRNMKACNGFHLLLKFFYPLIDKHGYENFYNVLNTWKHPAQIVRLHAPSGRITQMEDLICKHEEKLYTYLLRCKNARNGLLRYEKELMTPIKASAEKMRDWRNAYYKALRFYESERKIAEELGLPEMLPWKYRRFNEIRNDRFVDMDDYRF